jgi:tetratricopeptide (TPR) repeat protein
MGESRHALEAYQRAADLAHTIGHERRLLEILTNSALVYVQLGQPAPAEQYYTEALTLAHQHQQPFNAAKIAMNLGVLYTAQGRLGQAQRMFHQAYAGFCQQQNAGDAALVQIRQAALYRALGLTDEAMIAAQDAVTVLKDLDWPAEHAEALTELLRTQQQAGMLRSAASTADAALAAWEQRNDILRSAEVLGERAALAYARTQYPAALADARAALARFAASPEARPFWAAGARRIEAGALHHSGAIDAARQAYHALLRDSQHLGDYWSMQAALLGLGQLLADAGDDDQAWHTLMQAAEALEQVRRTLPAEELKARFILRHDAVYDMLVNMAGGRHDALATFAVMLRAKGGGLLDSIQMERTANGLTPDEQHELAQVRHLLAWTRAQLNRIETQPPHIDSDDYQQRIQIYEQRIRTLLRLRRQQHPLPDPDIHLTAQDVAARLPPDSGVLEYYMADSTLWGVLLRTDGSCTMHCLGSWGEPEQELVENLELLCLTVLGKSAGMRAVQPPHLEPVRNILHALWQRLLAPWETLPPHLYIAPHAALGSIPFAALWNGTHYLDEIHTIALLPSSVLLLVPEQSYGSVGPSLILGYSDHGAVPATVREAEQIHHLLPNAHCVTEDAASSAVLRSLTIAPRVLHVAAHAAIHPESPLFSMIHLSDGPMALESWYDLPLRGTHLAVLSACEIGRVIDPGGPLLAFQGALLGIGVQTLVCSLWRADDAAAEAVMQHFYAAWLAGASPAAALRQAQHLLRADPTMAHPALWAPFICCGPGAYHSSGNRSKTDC